MNLYMEVLAMLDIIYLAIDGEYGGKRKEFQIKNYQKKTKYLVPNK